MDIFDKNPYSRIQSSSWKSIENIRREIALKITHLDRFRREPNTFKKFKNIQNLLQEEFFLYFVKNKVFHLDSSIYEWPHLLKERMIKVEIY